ncbi:hypothetical protein RHMOL_Rhmol07G0195800 [Rhododendron molle]|uniref:Uncharacterized protein n=1 Tax=Rhododendron molle TaxID=49168 RepID=A0ACC0N362_RHOML|nr:hypothetical protein RHMOL_Rhmol07G0195800 [Rhododendron molle]
MFPIMYAFYGFFGALPPMETLEIGDEEGEVGGDEDANEGNLEKDEVLKDM